MKLHHLRLEGIGPFRDEVSVDFAALSQSGIFLLEGPTGAGKSTLLDAIVFALYGTVAGEGSSAERVRSQFADPSKPSFVDLVFETNAGIFRIRRQPQYQRAKKRGQGTVNQPAQALLWKLHSPDLIPAVIADQRGDGAGIEVRATRLDDIGKEISAAIGLTREQFTQTVLLPQGEFQRFLRARTGERQDVLTRVFGTELYERVEQELTEDRKRAKRERDQALAELHRAVTRFTEATGFEAVPSDSESDHSDPGVAEETVTLMELATGAEMDELKEAARMISNAVEESTSAADQAAASADERAHSAEQRLTAADLHLARVGRREKLAALEMQLREGTSEAEAYERRVRVHEAAAPVLQAHEREERAHSAVAAADRDLQELRRKHSGCNICASGPEGEAGASAWDAHLEAPEPLSALEAVISEHATKAGELTSLVQIETRLPEREQQLAQHGELLERATAERDQAQRSLDQRPAGLTELENVQREATKAAEGLADARVDVHTAQERERASRKAAELTLEMQAAHQQHEQASVTARDALRTESDLRQRRWASLAADMASELEGGEPCPVCGSSEHPALAQPGPDHVSDAELERAEHARQLADHALSAAHHAYETAKTRRDDARDQAAGLTVEDAASARAAAEDHLATVMSSQQRAQALDRDITQYRAHTENLRDRVRDLDAHVATLTSSIEEAQQRLSDDRERLAAASEGFSSIQQRQQHHQHLARYAQELRSAYAAVEAAGQHAREAELDTRTSWEEAQASLAQVTTRADSTALGEPTAPADPAASGAAAAQENAGALSTVEDLRAAVLSTDQREKLQSYLRQRAIDESKLHEGMAEPEIAAIDLTPSTRSDAVEGLEHARTDAHTAAAAARQAHAHAGQARDRGERTAAAHTHLLATLDATEHALAKAAHVIRIADLATGVSGKNVRLSTYVLMQRFDEVVTTANARLARMGGGFLELLRADDSTGAQKTGLDLLVIDRRTDQRRRPETLSGGETFIVSLALALGLADVVSAEAGGVHIQTLFIDEGFGSLDAERLDSVINEITHLAHGGRTVGIVSHVAELKTRIPEQISVRRNSDSTSTLSVRA